jgi:prepilin-type N-terminal cleavage/methylation domain-containing protein
MMTRLRCARRGFTVLELVVAVGILCVALVFIAQVSLGSLRERRRSDLRHEALEAAVNVLEAAQARPWEALTPDWAAAQRLPESFAARVQQGRLNVQVRPEKSQPRAKRVTVEIAWQLDEGMPARPVFLTGWFGARTALRAGGQP